VSANVRYSDLRRADLTGVDLTGVNLPRANLRGTDLRGACLSGTNLAGARCDSQTCWPTGFDPRARGAILTGALQRVPPQRRSNTTAPMGGRLRICPLLIWASGPPLARSGSNSTWNAGQEELKISL
jgi:pentapeptide repeat protein